MRKIELAAFQQQQLEAVLKKGIKDCNDAIRRCNAAGDKKSADYIREVKLQPKLEKLADVQHGYIWE